jgi:NADH dehydrogenase/NADH:ubiquinone oxidoreductase subunit G
MATNAPAEKPPENKIKIDGREIPFEKGDTIIRAAHRAGIDIPHYCWHPGLSVAANCRMCLVEVLPPPGRPAMELDILRWDAEKNDYVPAKKPKLQPACQQGCAPGMEVLSESSDHVSEARAGVQELLLLNHPVDCPICDQAGECRLQDYWLEHQRKGKRMTQEVVHKPKAQSSSGPPSSTTPSAASSARAACAWPPRSPKTRCSPCASAATSARSPSPRAASSTTTTR